MKRQIKQALKSTIAGLIRMSKKNRIGQYFMNQVLQSAMDEVTEIDHNGSHLKFATPNRLCIWRVKTFSTKEPETLEWIDQLDKNSVLWDIGANIGLYSVYAGKTKNCSVFAFEPSVFNLELLARNIFLNELNSKVCIVPLALSDKIGNSQMQLTTTDWGGALSTFGEDFGWDGKCINKVFEFQTVGLSMEDAVTRINIPQPDYIKIDVDGLEHFILKGGLSVLQGIKEILIEINDDFLEQANACRDLLTQAGLSLKEKRHSDMIANNTYGFQNSYNQIWTRQSK
jgi:FkbM family methyltransferase